LQHAGRSAAVDGADCMFADDLYELSDRRFVRQAGIVEVYGSELPAESKEDAL
jgi:hypothetical protein